MKTAVQISIGVLLGVFVLLFCMANDNWIVIHLPRAPWHAEPSVPVFEVRVFALMIVSFLAGIVLSLFVGYTSRLRRRGRDIEKDRKIKVLETELQKANRLMAATSGNRDSDTAADGGSQ